MEVRLHKRNSLLKNSIFNAGRTFLNLAFPVITFTYASRILGDAGIGRVSFSRSIISYFTMLAMLGMNYYGTREAAKLRDDREQLSKYVQEMLILNGYTTLIAYLLLGITIWLVPRLRAYEALLIINSVAIVLQGMGMEWLYQALEEYKYIAVRSMIFQLCAVCIMFFVVRDQNDVIPYAVIGLLANSGSYIMNFVHVRRYVSFRRFEKYEIRKHLRPVLWLFAMAVSIELYTVLDSTMLGFLKGDAAVGRYTAAVKVNKMFISLISSLGMVLIPRLSYYIGQGEERKVENLVRQALNYVFMLSIPAAIGLFMLSDEIILLFSGSRFATAGTTMRIMTPIVIIIPVSVVINIQVFVPKAKEKLILLSTCSGALTNFICNAYLIPRFAENGAAIATVIAELIVTVVCLVNAGRFYNRGKIFSSYHQYWIAAVPVIAICCLMRSLISNYVLRIITTIVCSVIGYSIMLFVQKNVYFLLVLEKAQNRLSDLRIKKSMV